MNVQILNITDTKVHIWRDIETLADKLGVSLEFEDRDDTSYPQKAYFMLGGIEYFQLMEV